MVVVNSANATLESYNFSTSQLSSFASNVSGTLKILTYSGNNPQNYCFVKFALIGVTWTTNFPFLSTYNYSNNLSNMLTRGFGNNVV